MISNGPIGRAAATTGFWSRIGWLAAILPFVSVSGASPAAAQGTYSIHELDGDTHFGYQVAAVGDMDQDGTPDLLIVGWNDTRVFSGRDGGLIRRIDGFYWSGAGCGDLDGDGFEEIVLGDNDNFAQPRPGKAEVVSGAWIATGAGQKLMHTFRGAGDDMLGNSVAGIGDVDNDNVPDIAVGAFQAAGAGYVRVFSGKTFGQLWQFHGAGGEALGSHVRGAGDVDGDGHPDVIAGGTGRARVFSGQDGALLWTISTGGDVAVDGIGDVDQDGHDDVIVGVGRESEVTVFSGKNRAVLMRIGGTPGLTGDFLGSSVAGVGDVNGDGVPDLIAGAPSFRNTGRAYALIVSGIGNPGTVLARLDTTPELGLHGFSVAGAGDVNGDAAPDVMVGTIRPNSAGSAYVFSGVPAVNRYGTGLAGSGSFSPTIGGAGGLPTPGNSGFAISVSRTIAGVPCMIAGSFARAETPFAGMTLYGDFLTADAFQTWSLVTTGFPNFPGAGRVTLSMPIPDDPALVGLETYWQGFVMDGGSTLPIGVTHTEGLSVLVVASGSPP